MSPNSVKDGDNCVRAERQMAGGTIVCLVFVLFSVWKSLLPVAIPVLSGASSIFHREGSVCFHTVPLYQGTMNPWFHQTFLFPLSPRSSEERQHPLLRKMCKESSLHADINIRPSNLQSLYSIVCQHHTCHRFLQLTFATSKESLPAIITVIVPS